MRVHKSRRSTRFSFHPYRDEWQKRRTSRTKKSFWQYLIWILALIILVGLIYYRLTSLEEF